MSGTALEVPTTLDVSLLPLFVLRSAGFPYDWMDELALVETATEVRRALEHEAAIEQQQVMFAPTFTHLLEQAQSGGAGRADFTALYRLDRAVRAGSPLTPAVLAEVRRLGGESWMVEPTPTRLTSWLERWQEVQQRRLAARAAATSAAVVELTRVRSVLREQLDRPAVAEAIWLSNPEVHDVGLASYRKHWRPDARPSKMRQQERRFYSYLQRLCTKNETTSFFGPLAYGRLGAAAGPGDEAGRPGADDGPVPRVGDRTRRRAFLAFGAVQALADRMAEDPDCRAHLRPRPDPLRPAAPASSAPSATSAPSPSPSPAQRAALAGDGSTSVADLARAARLEVAEVLAAALDLRDAGQLLLDVAVPAAELHPLTWLERWVTALPDGSGVRGRWLPVLEEVQTLLEQFETADLDGRRACAGRMSEVFDLHEVRLPPARPGQMFSDRTLIYEECLSGWASPHLSAATADRVSRALRPMVRVCLAAAARTRADLQAHGCTVLDGIGAGSEPVPFTRFLSAWRRATPPGGVPMLGRDRLARTIAELVAQRSDGVVAHLSSDELDSVSELVLEPTAFSPDVLLADGPVDDPDAVTVVLGEIHPGVTAAGWMLEFAPEPWRAQARQAAAAGGPGRLANLVLGRRMKTAPPEYAGPSVVANGVSAHPGALPLGHLRVAQSAGTLVALDPDGRRLVLRPPAYGVPVAYQPFASVSALLVGPLPIRTGTCTPRIVVDGAVYQRRTWLVPSAGLPRPGTPEVELLTEVLRLQRRLDLPTRCFVRSPVEPKPVFVDLENVFALELLAHLAAQSSELTFTELSPEPSRRWSGGAHRYCAELRTTVLTSGPGPAAPGSAAGWGAP